MISALGSVGLVQAGIWPTATDLGGSVAGWATWLGQFVLIPSNSMVLEYLTDRLVERVAEEIDLGEPLLP